MVVRGKRLFCKFAQALGHARWKVDCDVAAVYAEVARYPAHAVDQAPHPLQYLTICRAVIGRNDLDYAACRPIAHVRGVPSASRVMDTLIHIESSRSLRRM